MSDASCHEPAGTVGAFLCRGGQLLRAAAIENPRLEARLLLAEATGWTQGSLITSPRRAVEPEAADRFVTMLRRRLDHEPMAYILGHQGFWSLDLEVSPDTLIPRADSEAVVEAALDLGEVPPRNILDLGTGTGCLLLALLKEWPRAFGVGIDLSPRAAALAARNAESCGVAARAAFMAADWNAALAGQFDLVVSNPPYIETSGLAALMTEVVGHEPARALDGGADGLAAYRVITGQLPALLRDGGHAVLELGIGQRDAVSVLAQTAGLLVRGCHADLNGIDRALILKKPFGEGRMRG